MAELRSHGNRASRHTHTNNRCVLTNNSDRDRTLREHGGSRMEEGRTGRERERGEGGREGGEG